MISTTGDPWVCGASARSCVGREFAVFVHRRVLEFGEVGRGKSLRLSALPMNDFSMSTNHYVPTPERDKKVFYLYLQPGSYVGRDGVRRAHRAVQTRGIASCSFETDLYTRAHPPCHTCGHPAPHTPVSQRRTPGARVRAPAVAALHNRPNRRRNRAERVLPDATSADL
jgi:hypothetical protein